MTQRTTSALPFFSLGRCVIHADFLGRGRITSDAGVLLLREAGKQLGLIDALNDAIPDPRNPGLITYPRGKGRFGRWVAPTETRAAKPANNPATDPMR